MRVLILLVALVCVASLCDARNAIAAQFREKRGIDGSSSFGSSFSMDSSMGSSMGSIGSSSSVMGESVFSSQSISMGSGVLRPAQAVGLKKAVIINPSMTPSLMDEVKHINQVLNMEPASAQEDKAAGATDLDAEDNSDEAKEARKQAMDDEVLMGPHSCNKLPSEAGCAEESSESGSFGSSSSSGSGSSSSGSRSFSGSSSSGSSSSSFSGSSSSGSSSSHSSSSGSSSSFSGSSSGSSSGSFGSSSSFSGSSSSRSSESSSSLF